MQTHPFFLLTREIRLRPGVRRQAERDAAFKRDTICQTDQLAKFKSGVTAAALQDAPRPPGSRAFRTGRVASVENLDN
jgi:hypothetical protein